MGVQFSRRDIEEASALIGDFEHHANDAGVGYIPWRGFSAYKQLQDWRDVREEVARAIRYINSIQKGAITAEGAEEDSFASVLGGAPTETGVRFKIDLAKIDAVRKELHKLLLAEEPSRHLQMVGTDIHFRSKLAKLGPGTTDGILVKAMLELAPDGGICKYSTVVKKMNELGVRKVGEGHPASIKMIQNIIRRLKSKFTLAKGKPILDTVREVGVSFENPEL